MVKVISLSEHAYKALKRRKGEGESFSDVVLRMTERKGPGSLLELAGKWSGDDADKVAKVLAKEREANKGRGFEL